VTEAIDPEQRQIVPRPAFEGEVGHDFADDAAKLVAVPRKTGSDAH